jgi:hypothetical protein
MKEEEQVPAAILNSPLPEGEGSGVRALSRCRGAGFRDQGRISGYVPLRVVRA